MNSCQAPAPTSRHNRVAALIACTLLLSGCGVHHPPPSSLQSQQGSLEAVSLGSRNATAEWLALFNADRQASGLSPVVSDEQLSSADLQHARYLVKNFPEEKKIGDWVHKEDSANPLYTREGETAGQTSDVLVHRGPPLEPGEALDWWLSAPFHALSMLDPELKKAGYGQYCEDGHCAAVLNVGRDLSWLRNAQRLNRNRQDDRRPWYDREWTDVIAKEVFPKPVVFPADRRTVGKNYFSGREWPDPLSACPGYTAPAGLPIVASFGAGFVPEISDYSLVCDGEKRGVCLITAESYSNPDPNTTDDARAGLTLYAAAFMIPRQPLPRGASCKASIARERQEYTWTFDVAPPAREGLESASSTY
jgi:uncharacterized protein YkwD